MNWIVPALFLAFCAWFIPGLLKVQEERAEARRLGRCGLDEYTPKDQLQRELQAWVLAERTRLYIKQIEDSFHSQTIARSWECRFKTAQGVKNWRRIKLLIHGEITG